MTTRPTQDVVHLAEDHVNAVAKVAAGIVRPSTTREAVRRILTSDDPDVIAALRAAVKTREDANVLAIRHEIREAFGADRDYRICAKHDLAECPFCEAT